MGLECMNVSGKASKHPERGPVFRFPSLEDPASSEWTEFLSAGPGLIDRAKVRLLSELVEGQYQDDLVADLLEMVTELEAGGSTADDIASRLVQEIRGMQLAGFDPGSGSVEMSIDLSAGIFGQMDAIGTFDLERGVKFETHRALRIRRAILDELSELRSELRSMDWLPRLVRSRANKLERVSRELESTLGRSPTEGEIAQRLNLPSGEFEKLVRDATAVTQVSLSRKYSEPDSNEDVLEIDVIEDKRGRDPVTEIQNKDLKDLIGRRLTSEERLILILYYYEEMTMKEIGATLDLSESRVSQMHLAILRRLKDQLEARRKSLVQ